MIDNFQPDEVDSFRMLNNIWKADSYAKTFGGAFKIV